MTELELLEKIINVLGNISVPCALAEQITDPITNVRKALIELVQQKIKAQNQQEEPEIQISEVAPVDEIPEDAEILS